MKNSHLLVASTALIALTGAAHAGLHFQNVTSTRIASTIAEVASNEKEVDFGDFDNDGDIDVLVANGFSDFGQRKNKLYRNNGGVFNEISASVPLFNTGSGDVARNGIFGDFNNDGWLDFTIICDANTGGDPGRTKIYIGQHSGGVWTGFTEEGIARLGAGTGGAACGGVAVDNNGDGVPDLYVGNYPGPSQDTMYFNNGTGFFSGVTGSNVPSDGDYTVDVAAADLNGDGKLDLLISNWSPNYIYWNGLSGFAHGDYSYSGSTTNLGAPGQNENAMEAGDFDGDGRLDIYWSNRVGAQDRILRNTGNDAMGRAQFTEINPLPASVNSSASRKATVADIDGDGRTDVLVMAEGRRPVILRNTTVGGVISFVDWTPATAFPTGSTHAGWHAQVFDSNNDGDKDIFVGGWSGDHLFEQIPSPTATEASLGGNLPALFNQAPIEVTGSGAEGEVDIYTASGISNGFISVILRGEDDYLLEVLNASDTVVATSNRGGLGVEEALQYTVTAAGVYKIRVTIVQSAGGGGGPTPADLNGDGNVGPADLGMLLGSWGIPGCGGAKVCPADLNGDGNVGPADLGVLLGSWGPVSSGDNEYTLEVLSRN